MRKESSRLSPINEGYITVEQYNDITSQMLAELKRHNIEIYDIYYCPHGKTENCSCIKPKTGMIKQAKENHPEIDFSKSFMIGDSMVDLELAIAMDIKGFGIGVGSEYNLRNIHQLTTIKELNKYI